MGIVQNYLNEYQKETPIWEVYLRIREEMRKKSQSLQEEYLEFFNKLAKKIEKKYKLKSIKKEYMKSFNQLGKKYKKNEEIYNKLISLKDIFLESYAFFIALDEKAPSMDYCNLLNVQKKYQESPKNFLCDDGYLKVHNELIKKHNENTKLKEELNNLGDTCSKFYQAIVILFEAEQVDKFELSFLQSKYQEFHDKFSEDLKSNNIFTVRVFNEELRKWNPTLRRTAKFGVESNDEKYIIITAFLAKFNAVDTNKLLKASGLEALHGRDPLYCSYIYCLQNKISYKECILKIYPEVQEKIKKVKNNKEQFEINSIKTLEIYVQASNEYYDRAASVGQESIPTQKMTNELLEIDTIEGFDNYISHNIDNFLEHRESPRRILCRYLLQHIKDNENYIKYEKSNDFPETLKMIWIAFIIFYCRITQVSVFNNQLRFLDDLSEDDAKDIFDSDNKLYLLNYVDGTKQIKRKTFLLLLYFLGKQDYINDSCDRCDFNTISKTNNSLFDKILYDLMQIKPMRHSQKVTIVAERLIEKLSEIYLVKLYCDLTYLNSLNPEIYEEIISVLIQKLDEIDKINEQNKLLITNVHDIYNCLNQIATYNLSSNYFEQIKSIIKKDITASEDIRKLSSELASKEIPARKENEKIENDKYLKYLQNPLFLSPNVYL